MSDAEFSATEDSVLVTEPVVQSSPSKPLRGASRRGRGSRGRPKRNRNISEDNDSSSNGLHVSSLKHVGKFRYLSNLTQNENAETEIAKPVASRGKRGSGRGRGRGRGSSNHVVPATNNVEAPSHVSRSGRRIKPNNRWAPDADFDPGPSKPPPGRSSTRKTTVKSAKNTTDWKNTSSQQIETESDNKTSQSENDESSKLPNKQVGSEQLEEIESEIKQSSDDHISHLSPSHKVSEQIEEGDTILEEENKDTENEVKLELNVLVPENTEVIVVNDATISVVVDGADIPVDAEEVGITTSETVELISNCENDEEPILNQVSESNCSMEDDSLHGESAALPPINTQSPTPDATESLIIESNTETRQSTPECDKDILNHVDSTESTGSERDDSSQGVAVKDTVAEHTSSAGNTPKGDDDAFDAQSVLISPKPVKVKSRWRRTSELEQVGVRNGNSEQSSCNNSPLSMSPKMNSNLLPAFDQKDCHEEKPRLAPENVTAILERMKTFQIVEENQYLTSRKTSKEVKRMLCDCTLSKEEIARGELGCGEDCINRLLMIEWYVVFYK